MASIVANRKTAPAVSGLVANGDTAGTGIILHWATPINPELWATEVWVSATNDRASATLAQTVTGNAYFYIVTPGIISTYYFWIRAVNIYGSASGAWYPTSPTAGVSGTVGLVKTANLAPGSVSMNAFAFTPAMVVGAGGANYVGVIGGTIVNNDTVNALTFMFTHSCKQSYSSGARNTKWLIRDETVNATIADWGTFAVINELPVVSAVYAIPPRTTRYIVLYWWGADNTVTISNRFFQALGLLR